MIDEDGAQNLADDIYQHYLTVKFGRPFFICIAGPVGSGKSTLANKLQKYFLQLHLKTCVVSTDNFLLPNSDLARLNIKKGSAESYDLDLINQFFAAAALRQSVAYPLYQHHNYDRDPDIQQHLSLDLQMLIVEGVNVCSLVAARRILCDFSVYLLATRTHCIEGITSRTQQLFRLYPEAIHPFKTIAQDPTKLQEAVVNNWQQINHYSSWSHKPRLMQLVNYYVDQKRIYPSRFSHKCSQGLVMLVLRNLYWRWRLWLALRR